MTPTASMGFVTFYASDFEATQFVAPVGEMSEEEFIAKSNHTIKHEWETEQDYIEAGYPFTHEHVRIVHAVWNPNMEFENQKGVWVIGKRGPTAVECYCIDLE